MNRDEYILRLRGQTERLSGLAEQLHETEGKRDELYELSAACLDGVITALRSVAYELEAMDVVWVPRGPDPLGEALNSGDGTYRP